VRTWRSPHGWLAALAVAVLAGCGGGGGGGADSKAQALGETAVVEYSQPTSAGAAGAGTMLAVTVLKVRKGTQDELKAGGLEADDKSATPYYVDVRFKNQGQVAVKRNIDVSLEDSDGNSLPSTLIFAFGGKPFELCPNVTEGMLKPGESFESCSLVLVPEGRDVETVLFVSQKANAEIVFSRWTAKTS
jgi:hypothetical protein